MADRLERGGGRASALVLATLLFSGCNVYTSSWLPQDVIVEPDPALLGTWTMEKDGDGQPISEESEGLEITIQRSEKMYRLAINSVKPPKPEKPQEVGEIRFYTWEKNMYCQVQDATGGTKPITLYRYQIDTKESVLSVEGLNPGTVEKHVQSGVVAGKLEQNPSLDSKDATISCGSKELLAYLKSGKAQFSPLGTFKKQKAK